MKLNDFLYDYENEQVKVFPKGATYVEKESLFRKKYRYVQIVLEDNKNDSKKRRNSRRRIKGHNSKGKRKN